MNSFASSALLALGFTVLLAAAPIQSISSPGASSDAGLLSSGPGSGAVKTSEPVKVWVRLKDKGPADGASGVGASGRNASGAGRGFEDRPVYGPYVEALGALGFACDTRIKWQNLVSGRIDPSRLVRLRALPFVAEVSPMPRKARIAPPLPRFPLAWNRLGLRKSSAEGLDYGAGRPLMESLHVDRVHAWLAATGRQPGKGVRIAVIDADFHMGAPFFDGFFTGNRIRDQWDFVDGDSQSVDREFKSSHGGECLSLIGGNLPGTLVGAAPDAEYLLYRSEDEDHEGVVEEDYVAAAIERAVDSGAQVISISLGYRYEFDSLPDLPYAAFDGRTRPSSIAALGAARRNVVVSVAMGNLPGNNHNPSTPSLTAPADADSILSVGIADGGRVLCSYSCTGPSADGRIKPEVVSLALGGGCTVTIADTRNAGGTLLGLSGTSFAAPMLAGIAALLRQAGPELAADSIRQALIATADRAAHPDSGLGYGVVDAWAAMVRVAGAVIPSLSSAGWVRLYHEGGPDPLFIPWETGKPMPDFQLLDLSGRRVSVTVQVTGPTLQIRPDHDLRSGVYLARIR